MSPHVQVWVHVIGNDRQMVCRCTCERTLSPGQIVAMRTAAGLSS